MITALELYAGIGGFAEAAGDAVEVVAACDASSHALEVHAHNHSHPTRQISLMGDVASKLEAFEAQLWWMSPPCTPHTRRGLKRDLDDPRAQTFEATLRAITALRPPMIGFENVAGFVDSEAHLKLVSVLGEAGYHVAQDVICPSELGMPNRRSRFYLAAALAFEPRFEPRPDVARRPLADFIQEPEDPKWVPERILEKYGGALLTVQADDPAAETACFTSAYGQSWVFSGSYLEREEGLRFFGDREVAGLLGFSDAFEFPAHFGRRHRWKLLGNSLSIPAVQEVLKALQVLPTTR